jgi:hypothetical protein
MSKNTIREDKTCLNCNYVVQSRFCPNCGQENIDPRKTFHHLFVHFFEDLTHYENSFWRTIKNLIFKPSSLTVEYLSGKRMSYLAPIRLYIFISFVTFFLITILDTDKKEDKNKDEIKMGLVTIKNNRGNKKPLKINDTLTAVEKEIIKLKKDKKFNDTVANEILEKIQKAEKLEKEEEEEKKGVELFQSGYKSIEELDSVKKSNPDKMNPIKYWFSKKTIPIHQKYSNTEIKEKFLEEMFHNTPKSLFIYMPLFAMVLWLFHNKKRWFYFDHGIFTLHYFSFLLLMLLIIKISSFLLAPFDNWFTNAIHFIINTIASIWMFYYFFPAHHRFYKETRSISFLKSILMLFINIFLFIIVLVLLAFYSFISIH